VPGISAFPVNYQAVIVVELWQALPKVPKSQNAPRNTNSNDQFALLEVRRPKIGQENLVVSRSISCNI
jgi:hypothetical protein